MLPDAVKMLSCVPAALHVSVRDVDGQWHDAVKTSTGNTPSLSEFGIHNSSDEDVVYVAAPVTLPRSKLEIKKQDGSVQVQRIVSKTDHVVFVSLTLGEICG